MQLKELVDMRYPSGWGGAAAVRVEEGTIYTSVAPELINDSMRLGSIVELVSKIMGGIKLYL